MIFLLEIDYYNRVSGIYETLCLTTANDFSIAGKVYLPALEVGISFEEFLYGRGSIGGLSASAVGDIVIPNSDGMFDHLENCSFSGRAFRSYWVDPEEKGVANLYVTGIITGVEFTVDAVTFAISDRFKSLDSAIIKPVFLGTNLGMGAAGGLEGGEGDIKGQKKPRLYGRCRNIQPFLINAFHLIYACNYDYDGNYAPVHSFWNVFGKGAEYLYEGDEATTEDLITASVSESYYKTCLAEGTFRLGTVPNGEVTCDVMEAFGEDSSVSKILGRIFLDFPEIALDETSLTALHTFSKCPAGIYITGDQTALDVINSLLSSLEAWMVPSSNGVAFFGNSSTTLDFPKHLISGEMLVTGTFDKVPTSTNKGNIPNHSVTVNHTKNWKVLEKGSLIDSIPADLLGYSTLLEFFAEEWRKSTVSDNTILDLELTSEAVEYNTLLQAPVKPKLRNGYFNAAISTVTPLDWVVVTDGLVDSDIYVANGIMTITRGGGASYSYASQTLVGPDQIYPGEYTLTFEIVSGIISVVILDNGVEAYNDYPTAVDGIVTLTFNLTTDNLEIRIGIIADIIAEIRSVNLSESDKWGTPDDEAQRRFTLRSVPEDRYKFSLPYEFAKDIMVGDQVMFKIGRFGLEEGKVFLVIGKELNFPSIEVSLDIWRYRDGN